MQTPLAVVGGQFDVRKLNEFLDELRGESDRGAALIGFLVVAFAEAVRLRRAEMSETDMDVPGRSICGFEFKVTALGRVPRVNRSRVN